MKMFVRPFMCTLNNISSFKYLSIHETVEYRHHKTLKDKRNMSEHQNIVH